MVPPDRPAMSSQPLLPSLQSTRDKLQADHHRHAKNLLRVSLKAAQFVGRLTKGHYRTGKCDDDQGRADHMGNNAQSDTGNSIMEQSGTAPGMMPSTERGTKPKLKEWVKKMSAVWAFLALKHKFSTPEDNTSTSLDTMPGLLPQVATQTSSPEASSMVAIEKDDRTDTYVENENGPEGHTEAKGSSKYGNDGVQRSPEAQGNSASRHANSGLEGSPEAHENNASRQEKMQADTNLKKGSTAKGISGINLVSPHEANAHACSSDKLHKKDESSKDQDREVDKNGMDNKENNRFTQHLNKGCTNHPTSGSLTPKEDWAVQDGEDDFNDENPFDDGFDQDDDANLLAMFEFFARHKDYKGRNLMACSAWQKFWEAFDEEFPGIAPSSKNLNQIFQGNLELQMEMHLFHDMKKGGASRGLNFVSFKTALHQAIGDYQFINVNSEQQWNDVMHHKGRGRG